MAEAAPGPRYVDRMVEVAGSPVHYVEAPSEGIPAMLIHGLGADWSVWQGISRRLFPALHLYYPDLRGHGRSAHPATGYRIEDYAADVAGLLRQLGPMAL